MHPMKGGRTPSDRRKGPGGHLTPDRGHYHAMPDSGTTSQDHANAAKSSAAPPTPPVRPKKRRKWGRRCLLTFVAIVLLGGGGLFLISTSWFLSGRAETVLADLLGGDVSVSRARYLGDGRLELESVVLTAPGVTGPAATIAEIDHLEVQLDPVRLRRFNFVVDEVAIDSMLLRLSEEVDGRGRFNLTSLRPVLEPGRRPQEPPQVGVEELRLEIGSHLGSAWNVRATRFFTCAFKPEAGGDGWYDLTMREVDPERGGAVQGGLDLTGRLNARTLASTVSVDSLELNQDTYALCPDVVRVFWDRVAPEGRVHDVALTVTADGDFDAEFSARGVSLTLPIDTAAVWARYERGDVEPATERRRMLVDSGTIRLSPRSLELDALEGVLGSAGTDEDVVGVPYRVDMDISALESLVWSKRGQWLEDIARAAPFSLELATENLQVGKDDGDAIELPMAVARALRILTLNEWTLSTRIAVARGQPTRVDGAWVASPVTSEGYAEITDASGSYRLFPYHLDDLSAQLHFNQDKLTLDYVRGRGESNADVLLTGSILAPFNNPRIELALTGRDVPVSDRLQDAFGPKLYEVFDRLRDKEANQDLLDRGLVDPAEFQCAGKTDFDLSIVRARNTAAGTPDDERSDLSITGDIQMHDVGIVTRDIAYPLTVHRGLLRLRENQVQIAGIDGAPGWEITTTQGGHGVVSGSIPLLNDADRTAGDDSDALVSGPGGTLRLEIEEDVVSPVLMRALERMGERPDGDATPNRTDLLRQLKLQGQLDYVVELTGIGGETTGWKIDLDLAGARCDAAAVVTRASGRTAADTEANWAINDMVGTAQATSEELTLNVTGQLAADDGLDPVDDKANAVRVIGTIGLQPTHATDLTIDVTNALIDEHPLDLVPEDALATFTELFNSLQPSGMVDATIDWETPAASPEMIDAGDMADPEITVNIIPRSLSATLGDEPVRVTRTSGSIRYDDGQFTIDELGLTLTEQDGLTSVMLLRGAIPTGNDSGPPIAISGDFGDMRLSGPVMREVFRRSGKAGAVDFLTKHHVDANFDATFSFDKSRPEVDRLRLQAQPDDIVFRVNDTPFAFGLDAGSEVELRQRRLIIRNVVGADASRIVNLNGWIGLGAQTEIDVVMDLDGRLRSPQITAILPAALVTALDSIEFEEGKASRLAGVHLQARQILREQVVDDEVTMETQWSFLVDGRLVLSDASFRTVLPLTAVNGPFDFSLTRRPGETPTVTISAHPDRMTLYNQELTNIRTRLSLTDDLSRLAIRGLSADVGAGRITGGGSLELEASGEYAIGLQLAQVDLAGFEFSFDAPESDVSPDDETDAETPKDAPRTFGGEVFGDLTIAGRRGDTTSRTGRGRIRVRDADLFSVPPILRAVQLFQAPVSPDEFDFLATEFFLSGDAIHFERIRFEATVDDQLVHSLEGVAVVDTNDLGISARFRSRSGIAVLREVIGAVGDLIARIEVGGTVFEPEARVVPLPDPRTPITMTHAPPRLAPIAGSGVGLDPPGTPPPFSDMQREASGPRQ